MAQVVFNNEAQNIDVAREYFELLIATNDTLERGLVTPNPDVKFKRKLGVLSAPVTFQDTSDSFNPPSDTATVDYVDLEIYPYSMQRKLSYDQIREVLMFAKLDPGALNNWLGTTQLNNAILAYYAKQIQSANNKVYWLGMNSVSEFNSVSSTIKNAYLGILPRMIADSSVVGLSAPLMLTITGLTAANPVVITHASGANDNLEIQDVVTFSSNVGGMTQIRGLSGAVTAKTATTTTVAINGSGFSSWTSGGTVTCINKSNVVAQLGRVYRSMPEAVKARGDAKIYVSGNIADAYMDAQATAGGNGVSSLYYLGTKELDYLGVEIVRMPHWLPNCILAARPANLHIGYDLASDENNINVLWAYPTMAEKHYRIDVNMQTGEVYTNPSENVIIKPATHA